MGPHKAAAARAAQRHLETNPPKLKLTHGQSDAILLRLVCEGRPLRWRWRHRWQLRRVDDELTQHWTCTRCGARKRVPLPHH